MIPEFSYSIGLGDDILTTLHYYAIGDPLNLFSAFVPSAYIAFFYSGLCIVRLFISGISFSLFFSYMKSGSLKAPRGITEKMALLAGALIYAFSGGSLFGAVYHPFFVNPLIDFPLILLGEEKLLREKKGYFLSLAVFLAAITNLYFFFMEAVLGVLFFLYRQFTAYHSERNIKEKMKEILLAALYSITGICMGGIITVPVLWRFITDSRSDGGLRFSLLYPISFYQSFPAEFLHYGYNDNWTMMGFGPLALISVVFALVSGKLVKEMRQVLIILTLFMLIPVAGFVLSDFTYMSNRWGFGYLLCVTYAVTLIFPYLLEGRGKTFIKIVIIISAVLFIEIISGAALDIPALIECVLALIMLAICLSDTIKEKEIMAAVLLLISCGGLVYAASYTYSPLKGGHTRTFLRNEQVIPGGGEKDYKSGSGAWKEAVKENFWHGEAEEVAKIAEVRNEEFRRYSGRKTVRNGGLLYGVSGAQYYWSISNPYVSQFLKDIAYIGSKTYSFTGFDDRTAINIMTGVKYYYDNKDDRLPFGYDPEMVNVVDSPYKDVYPIYENKLALPFGYATDRVMSGDEFEEISFIDRQEAFISSAVLNDENGNTGNSTEMDFSAEEAEYEIHAESDDVTVMENRIVTTAEDAEITLTFEGKADTETYFDVEGLDYKGISPMMPYGDNDPEIDPDNIYNSKSLENMDPYDRYKLLYRDIMFEEPHDSDIYVDFIRNNESFDVKRIEYRTEKERYYSGRHDFLVNSGYSTEPVTSMRITFSNPGIYTFNAIKVFTVPVGLYPDRLKELNIDTMENIDFHSNRQLYASNMISGDIDVEKEKVLVMQIPYSRGWSAYIDGKNTQVLRANTMFLGVRIPEGLHYIEMRYRTPFIGVGIIASVLGFICFVIETVFNISIRT